jgi:hypothetical protein
VQRLHAAHRDRPYASRSPVARGAARGGELAHVVGEVLQVRRRVACAVAVEAGQPVLDVGGVADLAHLAVADDVDPRTALREHHVDHRRLDDLRGLPRVERPSLLAAEHDLGDGGGARQAADVGGENPGAGSLHGPLLRCDAANAPACGTRRAAAGADSGSGQ